MGAYNTLVMRSKCSNCDQETDISIQFKFGSTWNYKYLLNDEIIWGANDKGIKGMKRVVLDGVSEDCNKCNETADYLIYIENDIIKSVELNTGQYDFNNSEGYFLILER